MLKLNASHFLDIVFSPSYIFSYILYVTALQYAEFQRWKVEK